MQRENCTGDYGKAHLTNIPGCSTKRVQRFRRTEIRNITEIILCEILCWIILGGNDDLVAAMGEEYVTEMKHVHNVLLDCIVQLGLPYLLIVLAFLAYMVPKCWRVITQKCRDGSCIFVALLVGLLTDGMVEIMLFSRWEGYNTLFMLMCGYILHICKSMDREKKEISSNPETCGNQTGTADV